MANINVYFKSDFKIILGSLTGWTTPFRLSFYTDNPATPYVASWDGHTYTNCHITNDDRLCIGFDNHQLGIGQLMMQPAFYLDDQCYADGTCMEVIPASAVVVTDNNIDYNITLANTGSSTLVTYGTLPAYYMKGDTGATGATGPQGPAGPRSEYAQSDHLTAVADHTQAGTDHATAASDHTQALSDHSQAGTDHATAVSDHATLNLYHDRADTDHVNAVADNVQAVSDHSQYVSDHSAAAADHTQARQDHTQARQDHTQASTDHATAVADHTTAGTDHTQASTDHSNAYQDRQRASSDHTRADSDHTQAYADHTQAGQDHTQAGLDHTQAGQDHTQAGTDHIRANTDHQDILDAIDDTEEAIAMVHRNVIALDYDTTDGDVYALIGSFNMTTSVETSQDGDVTLVEEIAEPA